MASLPETIREINSSIRAGFKQRFFPEEGELGEIAPGFPRAKFASLKT